WPHTSNTAAPAAPNADTTSTPRDMKSTVKTRRACERHRPIPRDDRGVAPCRPRPPQGRPRARLRHRRHGRHRTPRLRPRPGGRPPRAALAGVGPATARQGPQVLQHRRRHMTDQPLTGVALMSAEPPTWLRTASARLTDPDRAAFRDAVDAARAAGR